MSFFSAIQIEQVNAQLKLTKQLLEENNITQALLVLQQAEKEIPNHPQILYYLGVSYHKNQQFANAKNYYYQSLQIEQNDLALFGLAQIIWQEETAYNALPLFRKLANKKDTTLVFLIESARVALEAEFIEEARGWLYHALSSNENNDLVIFLLGLSYALQKEYNKSLPFYKRAVTLNKKKAHYWNNYANALCEEKELLQAIMAYKEAIQLTESSIILANLAELYLKLNEPEKAFPLWDLCFKKDKDNEALWHSFLVHQEEYPNEVHSRLPLAPPSILTSATAQHSLACFHEQKKQIKTALDIRKNIAKNFPSYQNNIISLFYLLSQNQSLETSLTFLKQASLPLKEKSQITLRLAQSYRLRQDMPTSLTLLDTSISYDSYNTTSWLLLGLYSLKHNEKQTAAICFMKANDLTLTIYKQIKQLLADLLANKKDINFCFRFFQACIVPIYLLDVPTWQVLLSSIPQERILLYHWLAKAITAHKSNNNYQKRKKYTYTNYKVRYTLYYKRTYKK